MKKAVFLDRDGVINRESGSYTYTKDAFRFNEDVPEALKILGNKGYLLIIVTNQSGIAKGVYGHCHVEALNEHMERLLAASGVSIAAIYYCPHHPDLTECLCRKPQSLLVEKALARFDIDPASSFMIGDSERDIVAGGSAGLTGILLEPNSSLLEVLPMIP